MQTKEQLIAAFRELQDGDSWLGYNAVEVLVGIDENLATNRAYEKGNSIWQLVNHISFWRDMVTKRIINRDYIPGDAEGLDEPSEKTAAAWETSKQNLANSCQRLTDAVQDMSEEDLFKPLSNGQTLFYNIHGCLLHDAFHLGQIMLLKRMYGV